MRDASLSAFWILLAGLALASDAAPPALATGDFLEWSGSDSTGQIAFRTPGGSYRCAFSSKTYFEANQRRARVSEIPAGAHLEVLSEPAAAPPGCNVLIVRVIPAPAKPQPTRSLQARLRSLRASASTDSFAPRGNLVVTGIALALDGGALRVRTREGITHTLQLRDDTRITGNGLPVPAPQIPSNHPIQIRAGLDADRKMEAYSIVWGDILLPARPLPEPATLISKDPP